MPIAVSCKCGKKFKVKDHLAGKAVRCPNCKGPLRIPGPASKARSKGAAAPSTPDGSGPIPDVDEQAALLRFQEAQKRKQLTAEEEASYEAEKKKLIDSYDQLSGKGAVKAGKDGKPAPRPTEEAPKKRTIVTKTVDAIAGICGTLLFKYVAGAVVLGAGVMGSVYLVQYITTYMHEESTVEMTNEERAKMLLEEAKLAVENWQWEKAKNCLDECVKLNRRLEVRRDYRNLRKQVDQARASPSGKP